MRLHADCECYSMYEELRMVQFVLFSPAKHTGHGSFLVDRELPFECFNQSLLTIRRNSSISKCALDKIDRIAQILLKMNKTVY